MRCVRGWLRPLWGRWVRWGADTGGVVLLNQPANSFQASGLGETEVGDEEDELWGKKRGGSLRWPVVERRTY